MTTTVDTPAINPEPITPETISPTPKPPWRQRLFGAGGLTFPAWAYLLFFFVVPVAWWCGTASATNPTSSPPMPPTN